MSGLKQKAKTLEVWIKEICHENWCYACPISKHHNCDNLRLIRLEDVIAKAVESYSYYYEKSERIYGCFALGALFDVNVLDAWNEPLAPEEFEKLLNEEKESLTIAEKDDVKASLKEIKEGRSKKFKNVNDFLKELKEKEAKP